ncbi:MAG: aldo/keto reductase, partial [Chloroflexi bacterium]|nr:aldo/keto reductase [Chloroflexota bacterium]
DRLGTSYLDLYLLHRDDPAVPVGEIMEWLNEHQASRLRSRPGVASCQPVSPLGVVLPGAGVPQRSLPGAR